MSCGNTDWVNKDDYWKNKFYTIVEENKKLERKIKRLESKLKKVKK